MQDLNNKVDLITGGSKGIGLGIAEAMVQEGMKVAVTSRSQASADQAADQLNKIKANSAIGIEADVVDYQAQEASVQKTIEAFGQLDVLIANAGVGHFAPIENLSLDQWKQTIDINLTGVFYSVKAAVPAI